MPGIALDQLFSDVSAARNMTDHLDDLVLTCQKDSELQKAVLKFQMEHAAAAASFQSPATGDVEGLIHAREHLEATLMRMLDLAVLVISTVLRRVTESQSRTTSRTSVGGRSPPSPSFEGAQGLPSSNRSLSPPSEDSATAAQLPPLHPCPNSVDDLAAGSDAARARDAEAMHHAVRVASSVFIVSEDLRTTMQKHALRTGLLELCKRAVCLPRLTELQYFAEGFKTDHVAVLSNFTFENSDVCRAVAEDEMLLLAILGATRIDEENPGMVEWAEFCIRNVCALSALARETIKAQKPMSQPTLAFPS